MKFDSLENVKAAFNNANIQLSSCPATIQVCDIPYSLKYISEHSLSEIILENKPAYAVYSTTDQYKQTAEQHQLEQSFACVWSQYFVNETVVLFDPSTMFPPNQINEAEQQIGDVVLVKLMLGWNTPIVKAKVDTGADFSSMHGEDIQTVNDVVKFKNKELSENIISAPIVDHLAVRTADGGIEYRPVVELDIEINDKPIKKARFNLNDRNSMDYCCLIGQNILEKTNFVINPKIDDIDVVPKQIDDDNFDSKTFEELLMAFIQKSE